MGNPPPPPPPGDNIGQRSRSMSSKTLKPLFEAITFEPEVVEIYGSLKNVPAAMTYIVRRTVFASHSSIVYRLISKFVHTLIAPILCTLKIKCIDKNNVTYFHSNQISHYKA